MLFGNSNRSTLYIENSPRRGISPIHRREYWTEDKGSLLLLLLNTVFQYVNFYVVAVMAPCLECEMLKSENEDLNMKLKDLSGKQNL
jgi:hypothetical protein